MTKSGLCGFNLSLQKVDDRYTWINKMIDLRFSIGELFEKLSEHKMQKDPKNDLNKLCDTLLDYVSKGHFEIYPKILELVENASGRSFSIARRAMPLIEQTSDYLMRFNDYYNVGSDELARIIPNLPKDLKELKKCLESRFRNEDRLIVGLRLVHAAVETPPVGKTYAHT